MAYTTIPVVTDFGIQTGTDRTFYAKWGWDKADTKEFEYLWNYATGDGIWFIGSRGNTTDKAVTWSAPENATKVKFTVKAIAKTKTVNNTEVAIWTCGWSTAKTYTLKDADPKVPSGLTATITNLKLTASLDNLDKDDLRATHIKFEIVKDHTKTIATGYAAISKGHASYTCSVDAGGSYKVRCRAYREKSGKKIFGEWSDYTTNELNTPPKAISKIIELRALSATSVYFKWQKVNKAESYEVEYTTKWTYFDSNSTDVKKVTIDAKFANHTEITGMESGKQYYFRVRAVNSSGNSPWFPTVNKEAPTIIIGKAPAEPTTWSSTTTAIVGETLNLYWMHNSEDGSSEVEAKLELSFIGSELPPDVIIIPHSTKEEDKGRPGTYSIDTSIYREGVSITWRVKTRGIVEDKWSPWSVKRTVDIYAKPTLAISIAEREGMYIKSLPITIEGDAGPNTQKPIGYYVAISSLDSYETVDDIGEKKIVNEGDIIYSVYLDNADSYPLELKLSAGDVDLVNNVRYIVIATVTMDSGLTSDPTQYDFHVSFEDVQMYPNAEIGKNEEDASVYIRPYCGDENGTFSKNVTLSVYRRDFDGGFTEIASDLDNLITTFVIDPHPSLDFARYRIVATSKTTGKVAFYDLPSYPINEKAVIIQWDETWSNFNVGDEEAELEEKPWSGSLLRLPYNIDVSDKNSLDVSLIEYIGRKHPVSYYGTQTGESSVWNVVVPKEDTETIYALRRLARYMGDVYVREPSGMGYWANITVSFNQKHKDLSVPVTLDIVRVEGGK